MDMLIKRNREGRRCLSEDGLGSSFVKDPELCMNAVYVKQISPCISSKGLSFTKSQEVSQSDKFSNLDSTKEEHFPNGSHIGCESTGNGCSQSGGEELSSGGCDSWCDSSPRNFTKKAQSSGTDKVQATHTPSIAVLPLTHSFHMTPPPGSTSNPLSYSTRASVAPPYPTPSPSSPPSSITPFASLQQGATNVNPTHGFEADTPTTDQSRG